MTGILVMWDVKATHNQKARYVFESEMKSGARVSDLGSGIRALPACAVWRVQVAV